MGNPKMTESENMEKGRTCNVLCLKCNVETEHHILYSFDVSGSEGVGNYDPEYEPPEYEIWWNNSYQTIRCGGCKSVSYREVSGFSEEEGSNEVLYPIRSKGKLTAKDFLNAPTTLRRIYRETIEAFNSECLTLCAGGLRAIVEGICAAKRVKKGPVEVRTKGKTTTQLKKNLQGKISGLCEKGILTKAKAKLLHAHRYLGNEALHDLEMPSVDELRLAIQIVEHVLEELYTLQDKAHEMKLRRKERQTRKRPSVADRLRGKIPNTK